MTRRHLTLLMAALVAASLLPAPAEAAVQNGSPRSMVVVSDDGADAALQAVVSAGGTVGRQIELIGGVMATLGPREAALLEKMSGVSVTLDYTLTVEDADYSGTAPSTYAASVGAPKMWDRGATGRGIGVALLDTGVTDHPDLAGRIVASADLTNEGTFSDSYGHGTFLAGLIAGNGASSQGRFTGVAPEAHLMSVKVAGADGVTTLGQVLYGLQLIDSSKEQYNIKVVTIALAGPAVSGPDPLVLAVERLWSDGLVVIAAAGNTGPTSGTIASPAVDPYILTVGSTDEQGTSSVEDDTIPAWSARGPSVYSMAKPDVVAPGKSLVSLRAPGSTADQQNSSARVGNDYFRGSGTSMSAAVASGAAALMLQAKPGLDPDHVKGAFMGSSGSVADSDIHATGAGAIDAAAATDSNAPAANQDLPSLSLGEAKGRVEVPADPMRGGKGSSFTWARNPSGGSDRWLARRWANEEWAARRWASAEWAARRWAGADWSGSDWAARRWAGQDWAARRWAGQMWAGADWSARRWAGADWASVVWATVGWR